LERDVRFSGVIELSPAHRKILEEIRLAGAGPEQLGSHGREFSDLERAGLIVFWPIRGQRPKGIFGPGVTPARWYLTAAGAEVIGFDERPLRFS
jgi:hypothetical protein